MKAFCPTCGTAADGLPGGRLTCAVCTTSFEVPRAQVQPTPQPAAPRPPPEVKPPPSFASPQQVLGPRPAFGGVGGSGARQLNQLALVSLILGIACCIPFSSVGAIACGVVGIQQVRASEGRQTGETHAMVGIALGAISLVLTLLGWVAGLLHR